MAEDYLSLLNVRDNPGMGVARQGEGEDTSTTRAVRQPVVSIWVGRWDVLGCVPGVP